MMRKTCNISIYVVGLEVILLLLGFGIILSYMKCCLFFILLHFIWCLEWAYGVLVCVGWVCTCYVSSVKVRVSSPTMWGLWIEFRLSGLMVDTLIY